MCHCIVMFNVHRTFNLLNVLYNVVYNISDKYIIAIYTSVDLDSFS